MAFGRGMRHGKFVYENSLSPYYRRDKWSPAPKGLIVFREDACPSGWTRIAELDGKFLKAGSSYNSAAGGSEEHSHDISDHTHLINGNTSYVNPNTGAMCDDGSTWVHTDINHSHGVSVTTDTGGGGNSSTQNNAEIQNRVSLIVCQKS